MKVVNVSTQQWPGNFFIFQRFAVPKAHPTRLTRVQGFGQGQSQNQGFGLGLGLDPKPHFRNSELWNIGHNPVAYVCLLFFRSSGEPADLCLLETQSYLLQFSSSSTSLVTMTRSSTARGSESRDGVITHNKLTGHCVSIKLSASVHERLISLASVQNCTRLNGLQQ